MDYLPFIDEINAPERDEVEARMQSEMQRILQVDQLHPEVVRLIGSCPHTDSKFDRELYETFKNTDANANTDEDMRTRKRPLDEEIVMREHKRKNPGIQMDRYDLNKCTSSRASLAVIENYLKHQELILQGPLPKTILNQWAVNNDYMDTSSMQLQRTIDVQEKQIRDINLYRQNMQLKNKPILEDAARRWKNKLVSNLNIR